MKTINLTPKPPGRFNFIGRVAYRFAHWLLKDEIAFAHATAALQNESILLQHNSIKQLVAANHSMKILCDRYKAELHGELH